MPTRISRSEAQGRVRVERAGAPCLMCALRDDQCGPSLHLERAGGVTVLLSRYALRWGHLLVLPDEHHTTFGSLPEATWLRMSARALHAARVLERLLSPSRCYVGAFGTAQSQVEMSSPHLHLHVLPVPGDDERPGQVLTWEHGVFTATDAEWAAWHAQLQAEWARPD